MTGTGTSQRRRGYHSPLRADRAGRTRAAVVAAATRLFAEHGWSGTSMRAVASEAGVSVETVYAAVGTKTDLLNRSLDVAIVGDDEPVPLDRRPEFAAMSHGALVDRCAAAATLAATTNARTAGLLRAVREGATREPDLAARLVTVHTGHRAMAHAGFAMIAGRALDETVSDGCWALISPETYDLLTGVAGWSPEQYARWTAGALERLLTVADTKNGVA